MKPLSLSTNVLAALVLVLARQETRAVQAHVVLTPGGTNFTYTLFNDEPASSHEYLNILHLNPNAPFEVVSTPTGWSFVTDNFSYVDWFCTNPLLAAPNDVAPAMSLSGFSLRSTVATSEDSGYAVTSWYRGLTGPGSAAQGPIQVPSIVSVAFTVTNTLNSASNTIQLTVLGIPSYRYAVQYSSNLVDWPFLGTSAAPFTLVETNASQFPKRFYRAVAAFDPATISGD